MSSRPAELPNDTREGTGAERGNESASNEPPTRNPGALAVEIVDPRNDPDAWDRSISKFPDANIFHTAGWAQVLCRTYRHQPLYLRFTGEDGAAFAHVPLMDVRSPVTGRRGVALPFSDFCPPLIQSRPGIDVDPQRHQIREALAGIAQDRAWKYLEVRGGAIAAPIPPSTPPSFLGHRLDLRIGPESLLANCSSSVRRALRKAEKSSLEVQIEHSEAAMRQFFRLHTSTRRRHGLPPQPYRFFQNIHDTLIQQQLGFVANAYRPNDGQPVASAVFLTFGNHAVYKFGASDEQAWDLRPNNLTLWEGIKHLASSGFQSLHFGRTSPHQDGLIRFKLSWGSQEERIDYHQYETNRHGWRSRTSESSDSESSFASRLARGCFAHAPAALNRLAGKLLYPHLD